MASVGFAGVTAMDCSVAAVTVSVVFPETVPRVAVMTDEPGPIPVARPLADIVATEVVAEAQVTEDEMFVEVPSEYVPVAVNGRVRPFVMLGLAGVTAIDCRVAAVTVSVVFPDMIPRVAVMTDDPAEMLVASPLEEIVATEGAPEDQVTSPVRSCAVVSEYRPTAWNCSAIPLAMLELSGVMRIDCKVAVVTEKIADPETMPEVAVITDEPAEMPVTRPFAATVATAVVPEVQVTEEVMLREVPSE